MEGLPHKSQVHGLVAVFRPEEGSRKVACLILKARQLNISVEL